MFSKGKSLRPKGLGDFLLGRFIFIEEVYMCVNYIDWTLMGWKSTIIIKAILRRA